MASSLPITHPNALDDASSVASVTDFSAVNSGGKLHLSIYKQFKLKLKHVRLRVGNE